MTRPTREPASDDDGDYEVGYGRPPLLTRFQRGRSGNPGGRPRGTTAERAKTLVLEEAYRLVKVRVGDKESTLPAIQAVLRAQIALAAKGNGPAQRAFLATVQAIERQIAETEPEPDISDMTVLEAARRIAHVLSEGARIQKKMDEESGGTEPADGAAHTPQELRRLAANTTVGEWNAAMRARRS
jgi:hypothetical protein